MNDDPLSMDDDRPSIGCHSPMAPGRCITIWTWLPSGSATQPTRRRLRKSWGSLTIPAPQATR